MFVIPMAGESARFRAAGYREPKYRLMAHGRPVFDHVLRSFAAYFATDPFLFVLRGDDSAEFVRARCRVLDIAEARIVVLDAATAGQAETVALGLERAGVPDAQAIFIFNIDTIRPGYRKPRAAAGADGTLEVFLGVGANWSFVRPDPQRPGLAAETAEKQAISPLCCTGLYHFASAGDFQWAYRNPPPPRSDAERRERYVAPLYNALIARGCEIGFEIVAPSDVIFCGVPEEYEHLLASNDIAKRLAS